MKSTTRKKKLFQKESELSDKDFDRDSMLRSKEFVSDRDIKIKQSEIMKKRREFQDVLNQISNAHISIAQIEQKILSLTDRKFLLTNNNSQNVLFEIGTI